MYFLPVRGIYFAPEHKMDPVMSCCQSGCKATTSLPLDSAGGTWKNRGEGSGLGFGAWLVLMGQTFESTAMDVGVFAKKCENKGFYCCCKTRFVLKATK